MRHRVFLVGWLILMLSAPPVFADKSPKKQQDDARSHYEAGRKAYNLGEFQAAADEFRDAYKLAGDAALLANIANAYRQLQNYERAIFFLKSYLREKPDAPNKSDMEARIAEMQKLLDAQKKPPATQAPAATPVVTVPPVVPAPGPTVTPIPAKTSIPIVVAPVSVPKVPVVIATVEKTPTPTEKPVIVPPLPTKPAPTPSQAAKAVEKPLTLLPPPERSHPGRMLKVVGAITAGLGAVALGAGVFYAAKVTEYNNEQRKTTFDSVRMRDLPAPFDQAKDEEARNNQTMSLVGYGAGAVLAATGAGVFYLGVRKDDRARNEAPVSIHLAPEISTDQSSVVATLRF